jgi:hypothetical protein
VLKRAWLRQGVWRSFVSVSHGLRALAKLLPSNYYRTTARMRQPVGCLFLFWLCDHLQSFGILQGLRLLFCNPTITTVYH